MSKKKHPSETPNNEEEINNAKREAGRKLFAKMAKVNQYPIDHRPAGTVDDGNDS
jgi:hypothetical protein